MSASSLLSLSWHLEGTNNPSASLELTLEPEAACQLDILRAAEEIGDVCWVWDWKEQRTLYISHRYEEVWGRPLNSVLNAAEDWHSAIHPQDRIRVEMAFASKAPQDRYSEEYRILRPNGEVRWIRDRSIAIRDPHGMVTQIAGVSEDITAERLA